MASLAAIVVMLVAHTPADADLWGHLRFGADLLRTGHLPLHDSYSFTSDIVWINHEWLSELLFAALYTRLGAVGVTAAKMLAVGGMARLLWQRARRSGATLFSAVVLVVLVVVATSTRTQAVRPQLFSVLLFTALLAIVDRLERSDRRAALAVPVVFCLWANTHGAWIVGLAVFGVWTATHRRAGLLALAAAATLVNPYGPRLWTFLRDTVGLARPEIGDWRPLFQLPASIVALELALAAIAIAAVWATKRIPPVKQLAMLAVLAVATVRISRIDAFLQIAIAWICAPAIVEALNRLEQILRRADGLTRRLPAHGFAAAALLVVAVAFSAAQMRRIPVDGDWIPDADALRFIKAHMARGRLVTWYDWGEYAIWHLSPGVRVSMDGRRETVYSDRVLREHFAFYTNASDDAWRYPERVGADRVWLPRELPIVGPLEQHGWRPVFESATSVVLARDAEASATSRLPTSIGSHSRSIFPGP